MEESYIAVEPKQFYKLTSADVTNQQRGFFETFTNCPVCGQSCVIKNGLLYNYKDWSYSQIYVEVTTQHTHNETSIGSGISCLLLLSMVYIIFKKFLHRFKSIK